MAQEAAVEVQETMGLDAEGEALPGHVPDLAGVESDRKLSARRRPILKVAAPVVALVLVAAVATLYQIYAGWESTDDAQIDGNVNPISSRVGGYVTHVYVDDNQYVKAGTLLVQVDPKDYQVALDSAKATFENDAATAAAREVSIPVTKVSTSSQITSAQAQVDHARAGVSAAKRQFAAAQAKLVEADANNSKAQDDVSRFKKLVDKQEIAEQQFTQAVDTAKAANAAVDAARASVQIAQDQVSQAQAKLSQAQAMLESAETGPSQVRIEKSRAQASAALVAKSRAAVEQAKLNLDYTRIVAPIDGVVAKRSAQVGEYVAPGQQLLAIIPLDDIWVTANFKETQLKNMRPGQQVEIYVDAFDRDYTGHVKSIAGGTGAIFSLLPPENATGNYVKVVQRVPVRIRFDKGQDPGRRLRPGMSAEPKVKVD
jgi:membrane fusion protein, multidrug efflux system